MVWFMVTYANHKHIKNRKMKRLDRLVQSFSSRNACVIWYIIKEWKTKIQVQQDGDRLKQNERKKKLFNEC